MPRIAWSRLERSDVVVFDTGGADKLVTMVLPGLPHRVLDCRFETIHATAGVAGRSALNALFRPSVRPGQLYTAYLLACLQQMRPRVVLTHVDNNVFFQSLSRRYPRAAFLAVQNGFRSEVSVSRPSQKAGGWLPEKPAAGSVIRLPHFFCFGRYESDLYRKLGHNVGEFHPVGSLRAGYYKTVVSARPAALEHDICLVSEWDAIAKEHLFPTIAHGVRRLNEFLKRYLDERPGARVTVAGRSDDPLEAELFRSALGARARFIPNDGAYSTYQAMERADVTLTLYSTAGFEAWGWGCKTLFCNASGDADLSCPVRGDFSVDSGGYELFRTRLDGFRGMTRARYAELYGEAARYMMAFDPRRPAHAAVRAFVEKALEGGRR